MCRHKQAPRRRASLKVLFPRGKTRAPSSDLLKQHIRSAQPGYEHLLYEKALHDVRPVIEDLPSYGNLFIAQTGYENLLDVKDLARCKIN